MGSTFASNQSDKNIENPIRPSLIAARTELDETTVSDLWYIDKIRRRNHKHVLV